MSKRSFEALEEEAKAPALRLVASSHAPSVSSNSFRNPHTSPTITVRAGYTEDVRVFQIRKVLLARRNASYLLNLSASAFFKNGVEEIELRYIQPLHFNIFIDWLQIQALPPVSTWRGRYQIDDPEVTIVELAILAKKCVVLHFGTHLLRLAVEYYTDHSLDESSPAITMAFNNLQENSPFCRVLVDALCKYGSIGNLVNVPHVFPSEFMLRIMMKLFELSEQARANISICFE